MQKRKAIIPIFAVVIALMMVGNVMAFSTSPPETPFEGKILDMNKRTDFDKDTPIAIQLEVEVEQKFSFSMEKMFGKYSNANSFVITLNNTTSVDFGNQTALELPDIVDGAEITFEHPVDGTIKFIPQKITGSKPQLIIAIDRSDNLTDGMNVTISIGLLNAYLGANIEIEHSVNVSALMTNNTITVYIEHFSTQTLTAEGNGSEADTSILVSFIFVVISGAFFMVYAVIHYKQSKNLLKTKNMDNIKKGTLWVGIIMLILAIVEYVYPFIYT